MSRTWTLTIDAPTHHTRDGKTRVLWINANSREHYMARARSQSWHWGVPSSS